MSIAYFRPHANGRAMELEIPRTVIMHMSDKELRSKIEHAIDILERSSKNLYYQNGVSACESNLRFMKNLIDEANTRPGFETLVLENAEKAYNDASTAIDDAERLKVLESKLRLYTMRLRAYRQISELSEEKLGYVREWNEMCVEIFSKGSKSLVIEMVKIVRGVNLKLIEPRVQKLS